MLMALGLPLPGNIFAHGWWTRDGKKMSKSIGNVIDPNEVADAHGVDSFRYFVLREVPFGLDGDFSIETFTTRFNTELANDLGNLLSRVVTMINKYFDGKVPPATFATDENAHPVDLKLRMKASALPSAIAEELGSLSFSKYLQEVWTLVSLANRYVEENAPWTLAKNKDFDRLGTVLYNLSESLRLIALHLYPVMPSTSQKIWDALGVNKQVSACSMQEEQQWGKLAVGTVIQTGAQLFPRIEKISDSGSGQDVVKVEKTRKMVTKMEKTEETPKPSSVPVVAAGLEPIGIEDFMKVDLRVGKIVSAERVVKSEKLVKLQVDIGTETRQVVAGIGKSYTPEELTGKSIVIVANLKPAKLMGIESQGMLLAASNGDLLAVGTFDRETKPGSRVK